MRQEEPASRQAGVLDYASPHGPTIKPRAWEGLLASLVACMFIVVGVVALWKSIWMDAPRVAIGLEAIGLGSFLTGVFVAADAVRCFRGE